MEKQNLKGFTLVELLVVTAIIILLVTISMLALFNYQKKSVDARIMATMSQISNVATLIYIDVSSYSSVCDQNNHTLAETDSRLKAIKDDVKKFVFQDAVCYSSGSSFCVQSLLSSGGNFCLDSSGFIGDSQVYCGAGGGANIKCTAP